jgi:predicted nucleotidyltransferase
MCGCSALSPRGEERPDSDIDLLIDLADDRGFEDYLALAEGLEEMLGRKVDLVLARSVSRFFRPLIEADARPL